MVKMTGFTIEQLLNFDNLSGIRLVAGNKRISNIITGTNIVDNPDVFDWLSAGEFVLSTGYIFKDNLEMQLRLVREMAEINCAGFGMKVNRYLNEIPGAMLAEADRLGLPMLEVPFQYSLSQVCRAIEGEIEKQSDVSLKKYIKIYNTITRYTFQSGNLEGMAQLICTLIQNPLIIVDNGWQLLAYAEHQDNQAPLAEYLNLQKDEPVFSTDFLDEIPDNMHQHSKSIKRKYPGLDVICRVMSVTADGVGYGFLIVWENVHKMTAPDYVALEMAAASIALELIKVKQIHEIKHHLRYDFFDDLLAGKIESVKAVNSLAEIHYMDARKVYICAVIKINVYNDIVNNPIKSMEKYLYLKKKMIDLIKKISYKMLRNIVSIHRGNLIILFIRAKENETDHISQDTRECIQNIYAEIHNLCDSIEIGVGNPCLNLLQMRKSYLNALEAIRISERIENESSVTFYEDIFIYHLLDSFQPRQKLTEFANHMLGKLVQYDQENKSELVLTLEKYFSHGGNVTLIAKKNYLHRNTLIYRIEKIKSILGTDLKHPEVLLELQIALKIIRMFNNIQEPAE